MIDPTDNGMVHLNSRYSFPETLERLESSLVGHGLKVFCRIDHGGEAEKAGLSMRPAQVIVFGSPRAGTPLMVAAPTLAIDLPLKALVWEAEDGDVRVSYNSPEYLQRRHGVPAELMANLAGAGTLLAKVVE